MKNIQQHYKPNSLTTSNMKHCFIVPDWDPWTEQLCHRILQSIPDAYIAYENVPLYINFLFRDI